MLESERTIWALPSREHFGNAVPRTLTATGVGGPGGYRDDSDIRTDPNGRPFLHGGLAKEVWDGVEQYTGISLSLTEVAEDWGSSEVSTKGTSC